jgi:hypothetical protein
MTAPIWERVACTICDKPFTEEQWDDRHDDLDGNDVHAECCPVCVTDTWAKDFTD